MVSIILSVVFISRPFPNFVQSKVFRICDHNVLIQRCKFDKWLHLRLTDRAVVTAAEHSYACIRVRYVVQYIFKAPEEVHFHAVFCEGHILPLRLMGSPDCIIILTIWLNPYHRDEYFFIWLHHKMNLKSPGHLIDLCTWVWRPRRHRPPQKTLIHDDHVILRHMLSGSWDDLAL